MSGEDEPRRTGGVPAVQSEHSQPGPLRVCHRILVSTVWPESKIRVGVKPHSSSLSSSSSQRPLDSPMGAAVSQPQTASAAAAASASSSRAAAGGGDPLFAELAVHYDRS